MITDVPDATDFKQTGIDHVNLAADQVFALFWDWEDSGLDEEWDDERQEFWSAAQRPLTNALALVEQGTEFLIKSRIAEVSPFLLISGSVRDWPRGADKNDLPFPEFRTLDAQDLIRAHNTVAQSRLEAGFVEQFEKLRRRRNTVMHTVDPSLRVTAEEVLLVGLEAVHELVGEVRWMALRRDYVYQTPAATATGGEWVETQLLQEIDLLLAFLTRQQLKKYFGFDKKQRRYRCIVCHNRDETGDLQVRTAQLRPNTPSSTNVYCFVCDTALEVERSDCPESGCKGNALATNPKICLTCLREL